MTETIYGTEIEHNGDVQMGLDYIYRHWNDSYILDVFENAKTSADYKARFKINFDHSNGSYVLTYVSPHHFALSWED